MKKWVLCVCLMAGGCAEADDNQGLGVQTVPIIHGSADAASAPEYRAVAAITVNVDDKKYILCSGTLVESNIILTAAHCLRDDAEFPFTSFARDSKIGVVFGDEADHGRSFAMDRYLAHAGYDSRTGANDLGIIWLAEEVPPEIAAPMPMIADRAVLETALDADKSIQFVGFGYDADNKDGVRLAAAGTAALYCPGWMEYCAADIDGGRVPRGSMLHRIDAGGPCRGDSGGPVLIAVDGALAAAAVVSYGDKACAQYSVSAVAADHSEWYEANVHPRDRSRGCSANDDISAHASCGAAGWGLWAACVSLLAMRRRRKKNA